MKAVLLSYAVSGLLSYIFQRDTNEAYFPWKFGIGVATCIIALLLISLIESVFSSILILITLGIISVLNEARLLAAVCFLTVFLTIGSSRTRSRNISWNVSTKSVFKVPPILRLVLFSVLIYFSYIVMASRGLLGETEAARASLLESSRFGPLAGRSESLLALSLVRSSPLIGYGLDASTLAADTIRETWGLLSQYGILTSNRTSRFEGFLHSAILDSAVIGGIFAMSFWLLSLRVVLANLNQNEYMSARERPLILFIVAYLIWSILFSPYLGTQRMLSMVFLSVMVFLFGSQVKGKNYEFN
jgi:hypothetical protein